MMKRIRNTRVAAAALAASALFAAPALADPGQGFGRYHGEAHRGDDARLVVVDVRGRTGTHVSSGRYDRYDDYDGRYDNRWRHDDIMREIVRDAVRSCRRAVRIEADRKGILDVDFEDVDIRRVAPRVAEVRFEAEFEGRRVELERNVTCTYTRGHVVDVRGVPTPPLYRYLHSGHRGTGGYGRGYVYDGYYARRVAQY